MDLNNRPLYDSALLTFVANTLNYCVLELLYDDKGKAIDLIYRDVNPACERLIGKSKEEIIGKSRRELFPNVEDNFVERLYEVDKTGNPTRFEEYGAGLQRYYDTYAWKIAENRIALVVTDITERKRTEEALRKAVIEKATSFYARSLIETSLDPLVTISSEGKITDVNEATVSVTGSSREELI